MLLMIIISIRSLLSQVKNQGFCGSCWAFSATGALEGHTFVATGELVSLSEQNLIDCDIGSINNGCAGGNQIEAFDFVRREGGIESEEKYRYKDFYDDDKSPHRLNI